MKTRISWKMTTLAFIKTRMDIIKVAEHFGLNCPQTIACGSSLGATSLLEAMKKGRLCRQRFLGAKQRICRAAPLVDFILACLFLQTFHLFPEMVSAAFPRGRRKRARTNGALQKDAGNG